MVKHKEGGNDVIHTLGQKPQRAEFNICKIQTPKLETAYTIRRKCRIIFVKAKKSAFEVWLAPPLNIVLMKRKVDIITLVITLIITQLEMLLQLPVWVICLE